VVAERNARKLAAEAMDSFVQNLWTPLCPINVPESIPSGAVPSEPALALKSLREKQLERVAKQAETIASMDKCDEQWNECIQAMVCHDAGYTIQADSFSRDLSTTARVINDRQRIMEEKHSVRLSYQENLRPLEERLWLTASLLNEQSLQAELPDAAGWLQEINNRLLPALRGLMKHHKAVLEFSDIPQRFSQCLHYLEHSVQTDELHSAARLCLGRLAKQLGVKSALFSDVAYPFEHADSSITVETFLCPAKPDADDPGQVYEAASKLLESYFQLYHRLLSRLCEIGVAVEQHCGLERLPIPDKPDKE